VESDPGALRVLRANVKALGLSGGEVVRAKVERVVEAPPPGPAYDAVFLDPPYATADSTVHRVLDALVTQGMARRGCDGGGGTAHEGAGAGVAGRPESPSATGATARDALVRSRPLGVRSVVEVGVVGRCAGAALRVSPGPSTP
jgi:hypothetical protein